ncbi:MAG: YeiH family protein [Alkalibacterium gilvum]|uniref:YeiH family protein n=1 Tax=Alkalibacterium sp. TaxID=1872447 RepID=UPI002649C7C9|nr:YeiH family protein [Alkalibacterium sp.]MDN6293305.1 YeiH family protein [Alkalibacterium sp.]MDN6295313.1 YeiH family protein [Alkalibacterium sp.]
MVKENTLHEIKNLGPGILTALMVALVAKAIEGLLPIHLIGASVIALFIGIIINSFHNPGERLKPGLKFTSKKILKLAIILLGSSLSIGTILNVGKLSLVVMLFTLLTCFGGGYIIGKLLGLNWKLSNLISAGTGICGGSAIAAVAPVIEAEDRDIAYAMSATFLFDIVMIVLFPIMGNWLGLSDMAYGLWAGTAVNDTSSVVAAGYAFSESAGDFATMVKLTRTLAIIPVVISFGVINARLKQKEAALSNVEGQVKKKLNISSVFPWFILGFVAMAIINSLGIIPSNITSIIKELSKFLMIAALASIGLNTNFNEMKKSGFAPMVHGFIISALVVIVAITVEYFMGIV